MRLKSLVLLPILLASYAPGQVWEKSLSPGMTYRMEIQPMLPRVIHSIRMVPTAPGLRVVPELAGKTVYDEGLSKGRRTVTEIVADAGAMGGLNGDLFGQSGDPLGFMVRNGEMLSSPYPGRSFFAWGPGGAISGFAKWDGTLAVEGGPELAFSGWNQEAGLNRAALNTPAAGLAVAKVPNVHIVLRTEATEYPPNAETSATVSAIQADLGSIPVEPGTLVLSANGTSAAPFLNLKVGQKVTIRSKLEGFDSTKYTQAVGGGPVLLQDGKQVLDAEGQRFDEVFSKRRHSRTAIGRTAEGDLLFVVVDGRQTMSVGATLEELAVIMRRLGCVDAINLDGGGSSALAMRGILLNRPSEGVQRPVANGITFFAPDPTIPGSINPTSELKLVGAAKAPLDSQLQFQVQNPDGTTVPHAEVLWSCQGAAWIDQGGLLRPLKDGLAEVSAYARGRIFRRTVTVGKGPLPPKPVAPPVPKSDGKPG